ncbi:sortase domain-containing protein [Ruania halotolerans]|uniref:sortase domain-containing protein n=1 Tax=Ruania halotolerans TaxID=2897773 RepID=UPI001E4EB744|nr:sortase [Ruania halotolerans]UFU06566.1 sortase [Ruania halotolerans]
MMRHTYGRRAGLAVCAAAAALALTACAGPDDGATAPAPTSAGQVEEIPAQDAPTAEPSPTPSPTTEPTEPTEAAEPEAEPASLPASEPTVVSVPAIGVDAELMDLGLQDNGLIEVPPYNLGSPPGWYVHSPTPGEIGPSVVLGHRNGIEGGPGIFADLPQLEVGDSIEVAREDGSVATFTVYRTELFDKSREGFPTLEVYGNTTEAEIRLITCDGLNDATGVLEDNFIAYGVLDS